MPREMKTCGKCGKQKEAAEFYVSRLSVTGAPILMSRCKACCRSDARNPKEGPKVSRSVDRSKAWCACGKRKSPDSSRCMECHRKYQSDAWRRAIVRAFCNRRRHISDEWSRVLVLRTNKRTRYQQLRTSIRRIGCDWGVSIGIASRDLRRAVANARRHDRDIFARCLENRTRNISARNMATKITAVGLRKKLVEQGYRCALSGARLTPKNLRVYHIVPLVAGGEDTLENVWLVTDVANRMKGTMSVDELVETCRMIVETVSRVLPDGGATNGFPPAVLDSVSQSTHHNEVEP